MTDKLWFTKDGADITQGIDLRNGKANPFGWSVYDVFHDETRIGVLYCGEPQDMIDGYGFRYERDVE